MGFAGAGWGWGHGGRRMQVRVERRDTEIEHLRVVWGTLLTSHPNLDR
jgi:hypothetical protein